MGVQRLTSWSKKKPQRDLLYEKADLAEFKGKRFIIDASSFTFFIMMNVMGQQDLMYCLGDHGPDFLAATRYFILTFFHTHDIETLWVFDGSFNPAKKMTQQSRRAERIAPQVDFNNRLFASLRNRPKKWSEHESFYEIAHEVTTDLRDMPGGEASAWLGDSTGIHEGLYALLEDLRLQEGVRLEQVRTVLEADAFLAAQCLKENFDAVLSDDSDFLALDCPWIPLRSLEHRSAGSEGNCLCLIVPRGRFSAVMYEMALATLAPSLAVAGLGPSRMLASLPLKEQYGGLLPYPAFQKLMPDLATLLGNDFFATTDPLSGQSRGFVKKVTVPLQGGGGAQQQKQQQQQPPGPGRGGGFGGRGAYNNNNNNNNNRQGQQQRRQMTTVTCDLTDMVSCARFLLVCVLNGWVGDDRSGGSGLLDISESSPLGRYLFPNAPLRMQEYLTAREQYDLESGMAMNRIPQVLVDAGIADQYAELRMRDHKANLLCPMGEEGDDDEGGGNQTAGSKKKKPPRLRPLSKLISLQQYGFPMANLTLQRRMGYELLFYRRSNAGDADRHSLAFLQACLSETEVEEGQDAPSSIEIVEEYVRLHPNTSKVDPRQPFQSVRVRLLLPVPPPPPPPPSSLEEEEDSSKCKMNKKTDWRLSQPTRFAKYLEYGPGFHLLPPETRFSFFLSLVGYPQEEGQAAVGKVKSLLFSSSETDADGEGDERGLEDEIYAFVLALRSLLLAYGKDNGVILTDPSQRNYGAYQALLRATAASLLGSSSSSSSFSQQLTFDPLSRLVPPTYPPWVTDKNCTQAHTHTPVTTEARLRGTAFLLCFRACLGQLLEFSDVLGRVLQLRRPLTLDMSHTLVQKYVGSVGVCLGKEEGNGEGEGGGEGESEEKKERQLVRALMEAVLVGVEEEMNVYY